MYLVEGNIGVGKSTFLKLVDELAPEIGIVPEPLENWTNKDFGESLLKEFYNNTPRWAYTIETLTMICRVQHHIEEAKSANPLRLMERSVYSGHYCFAKNDYANGHLREVEWRIYHEWVDFLIKQRCKSPSGFIYLQASPEVCYDRMQRRKRESEAGVELKYLQQIHYWHELFLIEKKDWFNNIAHVPVLVLDCNKDFLENVDIMKKHVMDIRSFMTSTTKVENPGINSLTY